MRRLAAFILTGTLVAGCAGNEAKWIIPTHAEQIELADGSSGWAIKCGFLVNCVTRAREVCAPAAYSIVDQAAPTPQRILVDRLGGNRTLLEIRCGSTESP